jgi:hypothetical protein
MTVSNKPGHRGEREVSRKPLRAGMPGDSGGPVVTTLVCFFLSAREAAGALGTRHSPRPLFSERRNGSWQNSGKSRREIAESYVKLQQLVIARSKVTKQSMRIRAIRWLNNDGVATDRWKEPQVRFVSLGWARVLRHKA